MRFKKSPQLPGAGRTRAWHHHGSHTPTSPGPILLSKMACQPKHFGRQCIRSTISWCNDKIKPTVVQCMGTIRSPKNLVSIDTIQASRVFMHLVALNKRVCTYN